MALLTPADYPAIRAALDVSLTPAVLPDAVIEMPIFLGAAEMEVAARDPAAGTREGDALQRLKNAVIYFAAANLAPVVPIYLRERLLSYEYQRPAVDWNARAADLRAQAEAELVAVLGSQTVERPTFFALASGRRGL